jgi:hypothetical protein
MRPFLFLSAIVASFASVTVKDCSSGTSVFRVVALSFAPDAPVGGQNGTLHSVYDVPAEYTAGTARYSCSINGLPVYDESFDICTQTTCPIVVGTHDDYSTSEVPSVSGRVSCKIEWTDLGDKQLLCIQTIMTLSSVEKKLLRGVKPNFHFHNHRNHYHIRNDTCPSVHEYDPSFLEQEIVETTEADPQPQDPSDLAKKSLIALRSSMKYL